MVLQMNGTPSQPSPEITLSVPSERCFTGCMIRFAFILGIAASVASVMQRLLIGPRVHHIIRETHPVMGFDPILSLWTNVCPVM